MIKMPNTNNSIFIRLKQIYWRRQKNPSVLMHLNYILCAERENTNLEASSALVLCLSS